MMVVGGTLEIVPQGGKTAEARGQVKKIYQRVAEETQAGFFPAANNVYQFQAA